jgi:hypothetical protein
MRSSAEGVCDPPQALNVTRQVISAEPSCRGVIICRLLLRDMLEGSFK